ncbi:MAG: DUF2339 domain-containing protein, partial [Planctomycetota bacterium]
LERAVERLEGEQATRGSAKTVAPPPLPKTARMPPPPDPKPEPKPKPKPQPKPETKPEPAPEPVAATEPAQVPEETAQVPEKTKTRAPKTDASALSLEERIGGRWFNWVGILAILFGVAYGLKYSFDRDWITPVTRFWSGLVFGVVLLGAGTYSERHRYAALARGFWGGGIGVLFLVFFAGFKLLFDADGAPIIGRGVSFTGMAATVAVGVAIAVLYNTRTTALLSAIGGYLTPVLLTTGEPDQVFLFTYLSILTAGLLVLAYRQRWVFFRALTFWVVVAYFAGWWTAEGVGLPWAMLLYTSVMFLFFSAEIVAWSAFRGVVDEGWSYVVLGLNTTLHVLVGLTVLDSWFPAYKGLFLLGTAAWHFWGALLVHRRNASDRMLTLCLAHAAGVLFLLAPVFEARIGGHWLAIVWALQGAAFFWAAERWEGQGHTRAWGFGALGLAALRLLTQDVPQRLADVEPYMPFWSARAVAFGVVIATFAFACWRVPLRESSDLEVPQPERRAATGLWIVGLSLPAVFLSLELAQALGTYVKPPEAATKLTEAYEQSSANWMTLLWAAYATLVATVTGRRGAHVLRFAALLFGAVVLAKYVLFDLLATYATQGTPLVNARFVVTAVMAACLFWCAREFRFLAGFAKGAAHVLLLAGLSMEWVDLCHERGIDAGRWMDGPLLGVTLLMAGYGSGLVLRGGRMLFWTGIVVVTAAAAKWLLIDLAFAKGPVAGLFFQIRFLAAAGAASACFYAAQHGPAGAVAVPLRLLAHVVLVVALGAETLDLFVRHEWTPASALSVVRSGGFFVAAVGALYGLAALIIGVRRQRSYLRGFGLALLALSLAAGLGLLPQAAHATSLLFNTRLLGLAATVMGLLWAAELYRRKDRRLDAPLAVEKDALGDWLTLTGHGLVMLLLTLEASDYSFRVREDAIAGIDADSLRQLSYSLIWAVYSIGLVIAGLLRKFRPVRLMALAVLGVTIFKVFLFDLSFLENPYRILSFLVLGGILVGVSFLYQKYRAYLV